MSEEIDDSRCRFEVRGLEFLRGLEFAYSNDVVGEASSLKSKWGIFWKRLGGIGKYVLKRLLNFRIITMFIGLYMYTGR